MTLIWGYREVIEVGKSNFRVFGCIAQGSWIFFILSLYAVVTIKRESMENGHWMDTVNLKRKLINRTEESFAINKSRGIIREV